MTNTPQAGAVRGLLTDQQARVALGCCAIEWSQSGQNELTAKVGAATYVIVIALIEIPQACSLKFLTCEQRSV